jgi:hypothetical protein
MYNEFLDRTKSNISLMQLCPKYLKKISLVCLHGHFGQRSRTSCRIRISRAHPIFEPNYGLLVFKTLTKMLIFSPRVKA